MKLGIKTIELTKIKDQPIENKTKVLQLDVIEVDKHPQLAVKELGITYKLAIPMTINDSWYFIGYENLPKELPDYLEEVDIDIFKLIDKETYNKLNL